MTDFPQERTSNDGRRITVDRNEDHPERLVLTFEDEEIAELHPFEPSLGGWRLTYFDQYPETIVPGDPEEPPVEGAFFYVDMFLEERDGDEEGEG